MITKQFRTTVALLALSAVASVAVSAGQILRKAEPLKIGQIVQLNAVYHFGGHKLTVYNYTSYSIPQGTTINWSITGSDPSNSASRLEKKGSFILQHSLPTGNSVLYSQGVPWLHSAEPKAWYVK